MNVSSRLSRGGVNRSSLVGVCTFDTTNIVVLVDEIPLDETRCHGSRFTHQSSRETTTVSSLVSSERYLCSSAKREISFSSHSSGIIVSEGIRESDNGKNWIGYVSDTSQYSE